MTNENTITIFDNEEFGTVRTVELNGEVWFVGKDIASALGYSNPQKAITDHVDTDDYKSLQYKAFPKTGKVSLWTENDYSNKTVINESGLYALIFGSKLEKAKEFKHWVTSEVLPTIRKTGSFTIHQEKQGKSDKEIELERARFYRDIGLDYADRNPMYKQIMDAYATKEMSGEFLLPLPKVEQKTLSATDVGKILGISAKKVGSIANNNGLKTEANGIVVMDKDRGGSMRETFRYYENAIDVIKRYL